VNPLLAYRFFHRPLALAPDFARAVAESLSRPQASLVARAADPVDLPYQMVSDVAVVPVYGALVHTRTGWIDEMSYDEIALGVATAAADPNARAIVLHIASPGGEVDGCFELAEAIYGLRGAKPIWAICDPYAYSAAYAIASAADSIFVPQTGGAGSIGVVAMHVDVTGALKDSGIVVNLIHFGERKVERAMFVPLSEGARSRIQEEVDEIGVMFVDLVARNRGMSAAAVRGTKAGMFLGAAAVDVGLADAVLAPQEAFTALLGNLGG
jgi:capsid assembly protease